MSTLDEIRRNVDNCIPISSCRSLNVENDDKNCSATLLDLEALECPICCDALTIPIIQCDNGHIACSTCYNKLRNKCPSCSLPIGHIRCRAMERVLESVIVPCPNAKFGCTSKVSYGKELTHEKECAFSLCFCPAENCNDTGSYKHLFYHFDIHRAQRRYSHRLIFGEYVDVYFALTKYDSVIMDDHKDGLLFVAQCFRKPHGFYVTMSCIAPSAPEVGEFSCHISTVVGICNLTLKLPKVKRIRKLSFETPKEDFIWVPFDFLHGSGALKLRICVRELNKE